MKHDTKLASPRQVVRGEKLQGAILHWASFTLPTSEETGRDCAKWLLRHLPQGSVEVLQRGAMGYTQGYRVAAGGLILWNPDRLDMGVHCSLPGECLALMDCTPLQLLAMVTAEGGHFTRLDVAVDSYDVPISVVDEAMKRRDCVSRSVKKRFQGDYHEPGFCIYIGSRESDRFVRIYDKAAKAGVGGIWTRCECEFKHDGASMAAGHILAGADLRDLISSSVDFRDCSADSNRSRCPRLEWWDTWVCSAVRLSFALPATAAETVEKVYEWVRSVAAPALAFLDEYWNHHPTWLYELCDNNRYRISAQRQVLLASP